MRSDFDSGSFPSAREAGSVTRGRTTRRWIAAMAVAVSGVALAPACTSGQLAGQSPAYLIIDQLEGASGTSEQFSNTLSSDVQTGGVFEDEGRVSFRLALKDPGSTDSPTQPSTSNWITVTRYHVRFLRADGRNTPGLHVPYPFDGGMTMTVDGTGGAGTFVLVRVQSKLEAPLMALRGLGSAVAISTIAEVTFYGEDQAGRSVSVTGQLSVNFADWADPN